MTQAIFRQRGETIDYTPGADVAANAVVVSGDLVGVAPKAIAASVAGALCISGIFSVVKVTGAVTFNQRLYWAAAGDPVGGTAGTGALTTTGAGNVFAGYAVKAAAEGDARVELLLTPERRSLRFAVAAVAAAGSAQGDAAALIEGINVVSAADGTKGVILPTAVAGMIVIVKGTAAAVLKIYPATGAAINAVSANGAMSLASGAIPAILVATSATQWYTIPLVPS